MNRSTLYLVVAAVIACGCSFDIASLRGGREQRVDTIQSLAGEEHLQGGEQGKGESFANEGNLQEHGTDSTLHSPLDDSVTMALEIASLIEYLDDIQRQSNVLFCYLPDKLSKYENINVPEGTRTVRCTLNMILPDSSLTYQLMAGRSVVVYFK
jgi:hypothetical protein